MPLTGSALPRDKTNGLRGEQGVAVLELAICLPLILLTVVAALCLLEAADRRVVVERAAAAVAVAAIGPAGRSSGESREIVFSESGPSVSRRSRRVYLPDAPEGLRMVEATVVTAESGVDMVGIRWWPMSLVLRASYVVVQAPRY